MEESLTPRMLRIMEHAEVLANQHGIQKVGTEHFMLALLADKRAIATAALALIVDPELVNEEIRKIITSDGYRQGSSGGPSSAR